MDAFGAAVQAASMLILVINLIRKAIERQKDLADVLGKHTEELNETKCIVELVQNQDELQSGSIITTLSRIEAIGLALRDHVLAMAQDRSKVRGFAHQVTHGSGERQDLASSIALLVRAKQSLTLHIQLVQVGLIKEARKDITINTTLVAQINRVVQRTLGQDHGLQIAAFTQAMLKSRRPEADGTLKLTPTEYEALVRDGVKFAHLETDAKDQSGQTQRIICDNFSDESALQINVPVETDMWKDMNLVKVEGNVAKGDAIQGNYPMSMQVLDKLLQARLSTAGRAQAPRSKHHRNHH